MAYLENLGPQKILLLLEHDEWNTVKDRLTHDTKVRLGDWTEGPLGVGFIFLLASKESVLNELGSLRVRFVARE